MYLDIRFTAHKNGTKAPIAVLRKSVRKDGKVTHVDFGYLSGLPIETLYAIRDVLKSSNLSKKSNEKDNIIENSDLPLST